MASVKRAEPAVLPSPGLPASLLYQRFASGRIQLTAWTLIRSEVSSGGQSSWEAVRESLRNRDIRRLLVVFFGRSRVRELMNQVNQTVEFGHVAALTLVAATATKDGGMEIKVGLVWGD